MGSLALGVIPNQPNNNHKESPLPKFYLERLAIVAPLIIVSAPYVALGYHANPSQAVNSPAPKAPHGTKIMALPSAILQKKHLELVYSSELWRQCALESFLHNPSAHSKAQPDPGLCREQEWFLWWQPGPGVEFAFKYRYRCDSIDSAFCKQRIGRWGFQSIVGC